MLCFCAFMIKVSAQQSITLEDIWTKGSFSAKNVQGFNSMKDGRYYTAQDESENIIRYSFATGKAVDTLLRKDDVKISGYQYSWSNDESKVLLQNNLKQIYRHSYSAKVYVYDVKAKTLFQPVSESVLLAEFSPDGSKLAYVKENNLYCYDLISKKGNPDNQRWKSEQHY